MAGVTLNAPERRNALTPGMAAELLAAFDEVDGRTDVGALVIRATGKSFCAGGDIATLTSAGKDPAAPDAYEGMGTIYDSFYRLGQVRVPTVAAGRGSAGGGGQEKVAPPRPRGGAPQPRPVWGVPQAGDAPPRGGLVGPVRA